MDWTNMLRQAEDSMMGALVSMDDLVNRSLVEADKRIAEIEARAAERAAEDAQAWRELATAPDAPPEWRPVVDRVDRGELAWAEIATGGRPNDPDVAAAILASTAPQPEADTGEDYAEDEPFGGPILRRR
jgi:hypothetical protein